MPDPSAKDPTGTRRLEAELLRCCARTCLDAETARRVRALLQQAPDWDYLLGASDRYGVLPLLYWSLSRTCPERVPRVRLAQLQGRFYAHAAHNVALVGELLTLLNRLEAHRIPAIPFKGPILAASVYGNLSLRQCGDLDLLIRPQDISQAREVMLSLGYRLETPVRSDGLPRRSSTLEYRFNHEERKCVVELRWRLTRPYFRAACDHQRLWERCTRVALSGTAVPHLAAEDLLLLLCIHGSKHCWMHLLWICDVAELVRLHPNLDWRGVREQAGRLGCGRILSLGLLLASELLDAPLPAKVRRDAQSDRTARMLAAQVREQLFPGTDSGAGPLDTWASAAARRRFDLQVTERRRDRALYRLLQVRRWLRCLLEPNEKDRALVSLPASLGFLYYPLRPARLLARYGLARLAQSLRWR